MYKIIEGDFSNQKFSQEEYLNNWPMLYILENGKQAYIAADELYEVTSGNGGLGDKSYYKKDYYVQEFYELWKKLQKERIVKHSLEEIEQSDLFKYSP